MFARLCRARFLGQVEESPPAFHQHPFRPYEIRFLDGKLSFSNRANQPNPAAARSGETAGNVPCLKKVVLLIMQPGYLPRRGVTARSGAWTASMKTAA